MDSAFNVGSETPGKIAYKGEVLVRCDEPWDSLTVGHTDIETGMLGSADDCFGAKEEDDCFGDILRASHADPVREVGEKFNEEMWKGLGIAMERVLGLPPEKVIFSGPATIAIWHSGDKVVAKCSDNDEYDAEKGLMMCLLKKTYGSKAVDIIDEWLEEE